jgi:hypothetical protein
MFHFMRASSSVAFVADAVRIARSSEMLTLGMARGAFHHIATIDLTSTPYLLSEFCIVLSLFGVFSPDYKLLGEQCYWYVDVVCKSIQLRTRSVLLPGASYHLAGKYGGVKIHQAEDVRARLLETFEVLAEFCGVEEGKKEADWWAQKVDVIPYISLLLSPSTDVDTELSHRSVGALALITLPRLSSRSPITEGEAGRLLSLVLSLLPQDNSAAFNECALIASTNLLAFISVPTFIDTEPLVHLLRSSYPPTQLAAASLLIALVRKVPQVKRDMAKISVMSILADVLCSSPSVCLQTELIRAIYYTMLSSQCPNLLDAHITFICCVADVLSSRCKVQAELEKVLDSFVVPLGLDPDATLAAGPSRIISLIAAPEHTIQLSIISAIDEVVRSSINVGVDNQSNPLYGHDPTSSDNKDNSISRVQRLIRTLPLTATSGGGWDHYLGCGFQRQFERTGNMHDMEEATSNFRSAIELTPDNHADLPQRLKGSAISQIISVRVSTVVEKLQSWRKQSASAFEQWS